MKESGFSIFSGTLTGFIGFLNGIDLIKACVVALLTGAAAYLGQVLMKWILKNSFLTKNKAK